MGSQMMEVALWILLVELHQEGRGAPLTVGPAAPIPGSETLREDTFDSAPVKHCELLSTAAPWMFTGV